MDDPAIPGLESGLSKQCQAGKPMNETESHYRALVVCSANEACMRDLVYSSSPGISSGQQCTPSLAVYNVTSITYAFESAIIQRSGYKWLSGNCRVFLPLLTYRVMYHYSWSYLFPYKSCYGAISVEYRPNKHPRH